MRRAEALVAATVAVLLALAATPTLHAAGSASTDAIVQFHDLGDGLAALSAHGVVVLETAPTWDAALVRAPAARLDLLALDARVKSVEAHRTLPLLLETATVATRAAEVTGGADAIILDGEIVDGRGVGIAVVDTGVDGTHPDLADRLGRNLYWVGDPRQPSPDHVVPVLREGGASVFVDVDDSDLGSGHGTHVAGIAAGTGAASGGRHAGAAPGATLYGFGVGGGHGIWLWGAIKAFEWVHLHGHAQDPPIRVVTNSWGEAAGGAYDPDKLLNQAITTLADDGIVVVFAAGNGGTGDWNEDRVTPQCKHPHPGVVCVANYHDADTGSREGVIWTSSSRGDPLDDTTWPDVAAPGTGITAPRAKLGADAHAFDPDLPGKATRYATFTGTSMAAPHVAGVAALLLDADPGLRNDDVAALLRDTAHAFTFGGTFPNEATGHGLVDVRAAVESALAVPASPSAAPDHLLQTLTLALYGGTRNLENRFTGVDAGTTGDHADHLLGFYGLPPAGLDTRVLPPGITHVLPTRGTRPRAATPSSTPPSRRPSRSTVPAASWSRSFRSRGAGAAPTKAPSAKRTPGRTTAPWPSR